MQGSAKSTIHHIYDRISLNSFRIIKDIYHTCRVMGNHKKTVLFIVGCQRSGTSLMLERIFEKDLNTKTYGEFSKLSSQDESNRIRLNSLNLVKDEINRNRAPLIILKPLVETQNLPKLLNYFEDSKALWMYRHYREVVLSSLKLWGIKNGINNLRPIVENRTQNWRAENVSNVLRQTVLDHFSEDMNPYDAAALFWFVRNSFFFELNLQKNSQVMICKYGDLVTHPFHVMKQVYEFINHDFPGEKIVKDVHSGSTGRGSDVQLTPEIDQLCKKLLQQLDKVYGSQLEVIQKQGR